MTADDVHQRSPDREARMEQARLAWSVLLVPCMLAARWSAVAWTVGLVTAAILVAMQVAAVMPRRRRSNSDAADAIVRDTFPESVLERVLTCNNNDSHAHQPILDEYPEATVLLADLSGFTAWAAEQKDPRKVFALLERLFRAFDDLALKHRVFKLETVGDSYLAMAGAPLPDLHHADRVASLARDMMQAAERILCPEDGATTAPTTKLKLRIGIHTGPIVAGVVRCKSKQRYQIFGDTVNTASRLETLSTPGRIQVSEATAKALQANLAFLRRREDVILAKGKGPMQTYWLETSSCDAVRSKQQQLRRSKMSAIVSLEKQVALREQRRKQQSRPISNASILQSLEEALYHPKATPMPPRSSISQRSTVGLPVQPPMPSRSNLLLTPSVSRSRSLGDACFASL